MVVNDPQSKPFEPPKSPLRRKLWLAVSLVTAAALVVGGFVSYQYVFVRCADGVQERGPDDECVGVSTEGFPFDDHLKEVIGKIHEENQRVEDATENWVSVVYAQPMTPGANGKGWAGIRQDLQGAYLAQRELNQPGGGHGEFPQIKLLPANTGAGSRQWKPVVEQVIDMTEGDGRVVAVAGLGQSYDTTREAVDALRKNGIPMVGTSVTADDLSNRKNLMFFRAVAPNADQSRAIAKHLAVRQRDDPGFRVQIIKDLNPRDIYSTSLREGFMAAAEDAGLELDDVNLRFDSRDPAVNNALSSVAGKVCAVKGEQPDAVYFAGRGRYLKGFINGAGAERHCPVEVYSGDDADGVFLDTPWDENPKDYERFARNWADSGITVKYTTLAHPQAAPDIYRGTGIRVYEKFEDAYAEDFGNPDNLRSGQAMLSHDAVLCIGVAVREAAGPRGKGDVDPGSVQGMLIQISGRDALKGVSGPIDFDDAGNPHRKPLPLVQLEPKDPPAYTYQDEVLRP